MNDKKLLKRCLLTDEEFRIWLDEKYPNYSSTARAFIGISQLRSEATLDKAIPIILKVVEEENKLRFNPDWVPDTKAILDEFNEARSHWEDETNTRIEAERERMGDTLRSWLISDISDEELAKAFGVNKSDWEQLFNEKQATFNSYCASLIDECEYPLCKARQALGEK